MMEALARGCGDGSWINAVVGIGIGLALLGLIAVIAWFIERD